MWINCMKYSHEEQYKIYFVEKQTEKERNTVRHPVASSDCNILIEKHWLQDLASRPDCIDKWSQSGLVFFSAWTFNNFLNEIWNHDKRINYCDYWSTWYWISAGQLCLCNTSVLIVGAGGLGCPSAIYLTAAGIGKKVNIHRITNNHGNVCMYINKSSSIIKQQQ